MLRQIIYLGLVVFNGINAAKSVPCDNFFGNCDYGPANSTATCSGPTPLFPAIHCVFDCLPGFIKDDNRRCQPDVVGDNSSTACGYPAINCLKEYPLDKSFTPICYVGDQGGHCTINCNPGYPVSGEDGQCLPDNQISSCGSKQSVCTSTCISDGDDYKCAEDPKIASMED